MRIVCDIETNALHDPTDIWCVVCKDIDTMDVHTFRAGDRERFNSFLLRVTMLVGHNFIGYDAPILRRLWGVNLRHEIIVDTLVAGRLIYYSMPNGHSLDAWGARFNYPKSDFDDFSQWSQQLEDRCKTDVEINLKVYEYLRKYIEDPQWRDSLRVEHDTALALHEVEEKGFYYDKDKADELYKELVTLRASLEERMRRDFPPKPTLVREITPRATKHGTLHRQDFRWMAESEPVLDGYAPGCPFSLIEYQEFNPGSPKQVVERLDAAGWKPIDKTLSGKSWKVNETNIATLPDEAPESARSLVQWLLIDSRVRRLEEWRHHYRDTDHRIHGRISHIGSWTHRCAHTAPNMGNVPSLHTKYNGDDLAKLAYTYGSRMRGLWCATPGKKLVGCDAEGIQLRLFAHYIDEDEFTTALVSGSQEDGTDAHTINARTLGEGVTRAQAKTFLYSFLLGAGVGKAADILGVSVGEAKERRDGFIAKYPGLVYLREEVIPQDVSRGYLVGLDGRRVHIPENKREGNVAGYILGAYLQNGESVIMKWSMLQWMRELRRRNIDFDLVNFIHDEWQTETDEANAEVVGKIQSDALVLSTSQFNLKCPMAGAYRVGDNWFETH